MLIYVVFMRVMEMAIVEIVHVIIMFDGRVAAARTMNMVSIMPTAYMVWCTYVGIDGIDV